MTGGIGWVVAVNLIIWTGLFLYLLRLERGGCARWRKSHEKKNRLYLFGVLLLLAFAGFSFTSFKQTR